MKSDIFFEACKEICRQDNDEEAKTCEDFNLFSILNKERDEAHTHSPFIYELLNPQGRHHQRDRFLALFFEKVLDKRYSEYKVTRLTREDSFTIDGEKRRADFMISGIKQNEEKFCFPIEMKIDADEQRDQIERYYNKAREQAGASGEANVYFLTLDGREATTAGSGAQYTPISFEEHIYNWLVACIETSREIPNLFYTINQYFYLIKKITGRADKKIMNIQALIAQSSENMEAAIAVQKAIQSARVEKLKEVFKKMEWHIQNNTFVLAHGIKKIEATYEDKAEDYYNKRNSVYPCIAFQLSQKDGYIISYRIEIDTKLFHGISVYECTDGKAAQIPAPEKIKFYLQSCGIKLDPRWPYWPYWKYLYDDSYNNTFDFKNTPAGAYLRLFDKEQEEHLLDCIYKQIDSMIEDLYNKINR